MYLTYNFEVMCDVQQPAGWTDIEPRYKRELCDIEYDYHVNVGRKDLEEYFGHEISEELLEFIDVEGIEEDEDFIEFMKDRHEEEAYDAAVAENS